MATPIVQPYAEAALPAAPVRHEERIRDLERSLARLEGIVEQLAGAMDAEHRMMKESRAEDRLALKELGEKMERSVSGLAGEMKKLAERSAAVDAGVLAKQSQALGAIAVTRYIIGTGLAVGMFALAFQAGQSRPPMPSMEHGARRP